MSDPISQRVEFIEAYGGISDFVHEEQKKSNKERMDKLFYLHLLEEKGTDYGWRYDVVFPKGYGAEASENMRGIVRRVMGQWRAWNSIETLGRNTMMIEVMDSLVPAFRRTGLQAEPHTSQYGITVTILPSIF